MPQISIIIPIYNQEFYISKCLESILYQTFSDIEILCIDDCSTDSSISIVKEVQKLDGRIKVWTMQQNSGSGPTRNFGLEKAQGDYVAFMDPDDYYPHKEVLSKLWHGTQGQFYPLVGGHYLSDNGGRVFPHQGTLFFRDRIIDAITYGSARDYQRFIFKRKFINNNNILFPSYLRGQDPVFLAKVLSQQPSIAMINMESYVHRQGHSKVKATKENVLDLLRGHLDVFTILYQSKLYGAYLRELWALLGAFHLTTIFFLTKGYDSEVATLLLEVIKKVDIKYLSYSPVNTRWKMTIYFIKVFINAFISRLKYVLLPCYGKKIKLQ